VAGVSVLVLNLAAAVVGGASWWRDRPSVNFWYLLRVAQVSVMIQILLGGVLVFTGHEASNNLHYLYGLLPLPVSLIAEGARAGAAQQEIGDLDIDALDENQQRTLAMAIFRRETGIMTMSCIVIFLLALRAAEVSPVL
jgi:hypothetical protein